MSTIIGTDDSGTVRLVSTGENASSIPADWNGMRLTASVLTEDQEDAYDELPADRGGTVFDGKNFSSIAADEKPAPEKVLTADSLAALLEEKGLITETEIEETKE